MEINDVRTKLKSESSSADTGDAKPEIKFKKSTDPNKTSQPHIKKYCIRC